MVHVFTFSQFMYLYNFKWFLCCDHSLESLQTEIIQTNGHKIEIVWAVLKLEFEKAYNEYNYLLHSVTWTKTVLVFFSKSHGNCNSFFESVLCLGHTDWPVEYSHLFFNFLLIFEVVLVCHFVVDSIIVGPAKVMTQMWRLICVCNVWHLSH